MTINELILNTQKQARAIKKEHNIVTGFQRQNPWIIESVLNEIKLQQELNNIRPSAPTFDSVLTFKEEYLVDSMSKIYKQIAKKSDESCPVYFYKIIPDFYEVQQQKGFQLGEVDDLGYIVTGSNLVIETNVIQRDEFLTHYFTHSN